MAECDVEASSFPILSGCPTNNESFLVAGAAGGAGIGQYGRRLWSDIKSCAIAGLNFVRTQFVVGQTGSLIAAGQTTIIISVPGILAQSVFVTMSGPELPTDDNTQVSYDVTLSPSNMVIIFNSPAQNGQQYVIHYCYAT